MQAWTEFMWCVTLSNYTVYGCRVWRVHPNPFQTVAMGLVARHLVHMQVSTLVCMHNVANNNIVSVEL